MTREALLALAIVAGCGGGDGDDPDAAPPGVDAARTDAASADAAGPACPSETAIDTATAGEVAVIGDAGSTLGIFDPSIVYPAGAPGGAMSYSSVPDQRTIRTRIALSPDAGASWTFVAEINQPVAASVTSTDLDECPTGTCTGAMISEVTTLIVDPDDPDASRRWKLYAHRYLVAPDVTLHYRYGTIAVQTAPAPEGPWTAPAPLIGWDSASPVSSTGVTTNISTVAGVSDCIALTEPGALWRARPAGGSSIDLAAGCVYPVGAGFGIRIVLLRSLDHGASWSFIADLLGGADATCLDADPAATINAAALYVAGGVEYLAATPAHGNSGYEGCLVFRVDDPETGAVAAAPIRSVVASPLRFAGACTYAEGASAMGYAMPIGFFGDPRPFRIFTTGPTAP